MSRTDGTQRITQPGAAEVNKAHPASPGRAIVTPGTQEIPILCCVSVILRKKTALVYFAAAARACARQMGYYTQYTGICYKAEKQRKGKNPNSKAAKSKSNQKHSNGTTAPSRKSLYGYNHGYNTLEIYRTKSTDLYPNIPHNPP
jgi:hypothetical protein